MDQAQFSMDIAIDVLSSLSIREALYSASERGRSSAHLVANGAFVHNAEFRRSSSEPDLTKHHKMCISHVTQRLLKTNNDHLHDRLDELCTFG
ncbi:GH16962 [Drosophila grimshawi]|uniref:GH16962 n=1 Tax=Drosophila grimshawi TaxID=7222 RepID=B4JU56_DROGR|nr:GH16962 [Drosophila grimshawi]